MIRSAPRGDEPVVDHNRAKIEGRSSRSRRRGVVRRSTSETAATCTTLRSTRPGRRARPWLEQHDPLVRRRGGWPHRLFARAVLAGGDGCAIRDLPRGIIKEKVDLDYSPRSSSASERASRTSRRSCSTPRTRPRPRAYDRPSLLGQAAKKGYGENRATSTSWTSPRTTTAFNDHAHRRSAETIKDALNPNDLLSPGKQGIWPKGMRDYARRVAASAAGARTPGRSSGNGDFLRRLGGASMSSHDLRMRARRARRARPAPRRAPRSRRRPARG